MTWSAIKCPDSLLMWFAREAVKNGSSAAKKISIALYPTMTGSMLAASDEHAKRAAVSKGLPGS